MPFELSSDHVSVRWDEQNKWYFIVQNNAKRDTIDVYIDAVLDTMRETDKSKTYFSINDLSSPDVTFTPYYISRLGDLSSYAKENQLNGYVALVHSPGLAGQFLKSLSRPFEATARYLKMHHALTMEDAEKWVKKQQELHG